MAKFSISISKPFGPALGYADDLDHGKKLAGQVTQEIKLLSKIINVY